MRTVALTIAISLVSITCDAHDFSWDNLLLSKMKIQKGFDYEAHVDSYMKVFRPVVWKRYQNDEFELEDKRRETLSLMKDRVDAFQIEEEMELNGTMTLGGYDFDNLEFPIKEATESHYWYKSRYTSSDFPSSFSIYFSNPELIRTLPMEKDEARSFITRRKDRYGNVDRRIQMTLKFTVSKMKNAHDEFLVEIKSARFYDDKGRTRLVHQVTTPQRETAKIRR